MLDELLPFLHHRKTARTIRSRLAIWERKDGTLESNWVKYRLLGEEQLEKALRCEHARREQLQRRAQTFIGAIAVMSAFTIGGISLFRASEHALPLWFLGSSLLLVTCYLAGGAWSALTIVSPGQLYDLNLETQMGGEEPLPSDVRVDLLINLTKATQAQNLLLAYSSERAYRSMRNGLITLVFALATQIADAFVLKIGATG